MSSIRNTICALALARLAVAGYNLVDDYNSTNWLDSFAFEAIPDPTNGYVTYTTQAQAQQMGLFNSSNGQVYMGVDSTYPATGTGRESIRMQSNKIYTTGLFILDLAHMPASVCGTWPAFWTTNTTNWPNDGEIDIIEGVNNQATDSMTLHTGGAACDIEPPTQMSSMSKMLTQTCTGNDTDNTGCSISNTIKTSYGTGFNTAGGGIYAMEWTSQYIAMWMFPYASAPSDIASDSPDPSNWGAPSALFQGGCNIDESFQNHNIIFDTTFCGQWAGEQAWTSSGCAASYGSSCSAYVQNNPSAFAESYWLVNGLRVYQDTTPGIEVNIPTASAIIPPPAATPPPAAGTPPPAVVSSTSTTPPPAVVPSASTPPAPVTTVSALSAVTDVSTAPPAAASTPYVQSVMAVTVTGPAVTVTVMAY
jgi:hypothetical protein